MIGDQNDIFGRLMERLPRGWFGTVNPIASALMQGIAAVLVNVYACYQFLVAQTRLQTSTGGWVDMAAADYFGPTGLLRLATETDAAYIARIQINIVRERGTRNAVIEILTALTGRAPTIVEPMNPGDTGAYGGPTIGYGVAGAYGSMLLDYQAFVTAYRPIGTGIPLVAGYGVSTGGYSTPSRSDYADINQVQNPVTDALIYAAVAAVIPAATIAWMRISN